MQLDELKVRINDQNNESKLAKKLRLEELRQAKSNKIDVVVRTSDTLIE